MADTSELLQELSDCVVKVQGKSLPACSQILCLQSAYMTHMLRETKLELTADGRKILPFAEDEPAVAQLIESLHMSTQGRKSMVSQLSLAEVARILRLAVEYDCTDLAGRILTDICKSRLEILLTPCDPGSSGWRKKYFEFLSNDLPLLLQIAEAAEACGPQSLPEVAGLVTLVQHKLEAWTAGTQQYKSLSAEDFISWRKGKS